jgi:hypothetical protein
MSAVATTGAVGAYVELLSAPVLLTALGIGIFRYRLWDIDRLLNRTLVYRLLTAILGGAYAVGVLVIGQRLSPGDNPSSLAVAASTLAVAALFQPLRHARVAVAARAGVATSAGPGRRGRGRRGGWGGAAGGAANRPTLAATSYRRSTLVKMSASPMPVSAMALLRPSVQTG